MSVPNGNISTIDLSLVNSIETVVRDVVSKGRYGEVAIFFPIGTERIQDILEAWSKSTFWDLQQKVSLVSSVGSTRVIVENREELHTDNGEIMVVTSQEQLGQVRFMRRTAVPSARRCNAVEGGGRCEATSVEEVEPNVVEHPPVVRKTMRKRTWQLVYRRRFRYQVVQEWTVLALPHMASASTLDEKEASAAEQHNRIDLLERPTSTVVRLAWVFDPHSLSSGEHICCRDIAHSLLLKAKQFVSFAVAAGILQPS